MTKLQFNPPLLYSTAALLIAIAVNAVSFNTSHSLVSSAKATTVYSEQTVSLSGKWEVFAEETSTVDSKDSDTLKLKPTRKLPDFTNRNWQEINVPANWWLEGQDLSGVIWYRYRFPATPELKDKVVKLVFAGVDYTADAWLNNNYLGFHEGYFQPFSWLVQEHLNFTEENILIVRVNSPLEIQQQDWSLHKRLIKGVLSHHDARPGGAWSDRGQEQNTGGIWNDVFLEASEKVAIDNILVTPEINLQQQQGTAKIAIDVTNCSTTTEDASIRLQLVPDNFNDNSKEITVNEKLIPGSNHIELQITKDTPALWWTWEHGNPNLYSLKVDFVQQEKVLASTTTKFGFRTIEYDQKEQVWKLNGKRMFVRGTNYIATQWLSEMTAEKYAFDLSLMKQANINAVRVHAHITAPEFYDLCDRMGILVWQDFPLQWGYSESPEMEKQAISQGKDMINLLYNHPAIMAWSLHNEPPWDAAWMQYLYQNYDSNQNRKLDQKLFQSLKNIDPTRYLHFASTVNEHPWWGWYSHTWQKYGEPTTEPLITEFGAQALPNLSSLRKIFNEAELYPDTETAWQKWAYHNFQKKETFEIAGVSQGDTPQEFINNTQQYQAKLTKFAAEAYRHQRYQPVSAIFQFMFVENWASVNWGIVDYWRNPKPGFDALKMAYQPVLPIFKAAADRDAWTLGEAVKLNLSVANDLWQSYPEATISYTLNNHWQFQINGKISKEIKPDSLTNITEIAYQPMQPGKYELVATVRDRNNSLLGQNSFNFTVEPNSQELNSTTN